jgi:hypothetical protein
MVFSMSLIGKMKRDTPVAERGGRRVADARNSPRHTLVQLVLQGAAMRVMTGLVASALVACSGTTSSIRRDEGELLLPTRMNLTGFQHLRPVSGSASTGSAFCVFPLGDELYSDAMKDLYAHVQLGPNQMLLNVREDTADRRYFGLYCSKKLTVSADVVQLTTPAAQTPELQSAR